MSSTYPQVGSILITCHLNEEEPRDDRHRPHDLRHDERGRVRPDRQEGLRQGDQRRSWAASTARRILDAIFERFPSLFNPEKAKGADARVNWRITGGPDGGSDTYAVVVKDGTCTVEKDPTVEPTTSIMLGPAEFAKLITGSGNPTMMVMTGKIKARGDLSVAMAFQNWFDTPKG